MKPYSVYGHVHGFQVLIEPGNILFLLSNHLLLFVFEPSLLLFLLFLLHPCLMFSSLDILFLLTV
jgi:hypothetical protein